MGIPGMILVPVFLQCIKVEASQSKVAAAAPELLLSIAIAHGRRVTPSQRAALAWLPSAS